jgi:hypothetical protein
MPAGCVSQRVAEVEGVSGQEYLRSALRQKPGRIEPLDQGRPRGRRWCRSGAAVAVE